MSLNKPQIDSLLSVIGDHTASEEEWTKACHLLGDYKHEPPVAKRKSHMGIGIAALVLVLSFGTGLTLSKLPNATPTVAPPVASSVAPTADIDFGPYMATIQRKIKRAWFPPKGNESLRTVTIFRVGPDGTIANLAIEHSSGSLALDRACLEAVKNAGPFDPLPGNLKHSIDIEYTFGYNVFNNVDNSLTP